MKKIFMIAALAVATLTANAQIYVGGSLGFENNKADKHADRLTSFSIIPEVGYNLDENWAVGIQLGYQSQEESKDVTCSLFTIAPYARYTFAKVGVANFFVDGGIIFQSYGSDYKGSAFGIGVRPGVNFAVNEKVGVVAKLGYIGYTKNNDDLGGGSNFGINADNTNLELGIFFNF